MLEIRWHGRGGQGTKTASLILADAVFETGKYVQGFPEYGPERTGAPMTAYNRIDDERILIHSNIYNPDIVVVVDETLMKNIPVTKGLKPGGLLLINTNKEENEIYEEIDRKDITVYTINADKIAIEEIGKPYPNTCMLSAVIKVSNLISEEDFLRIMEQSLKRKFSSKPEVIEGNMNAIKKSWKEVKICGIR